MSLGKGSPRPISPGLKLAALAHRALPARGAGTAPTAAWPEKSERSQGGGGGGGGDGGGAEETEGEEDYHEDEEEEHLDEEEGAESRGHPVDDGTNDPDLIPGIVTGEDVVEFYAKYGQDSAVKFFYCNR